MTYRVGATLISGKYMQGKNYLVVNSELRSTTKFTTSSVAEGECIASNERKIPWLFGKIERNPNGIFDSDRSGLFDVCVLRT